MKPTPEQAKAFMSLRGSRVHEYLKAALEDRRSALETQTEHAVILQIQGDASRLRLLLKMIDN